ncbi:MAG: DUF5658 family protein [Dehalococcoidia bacterium]
MENTRVSGNAAGHRVAVERIYGARNSQALNHLWLVYILLGLQALDVLTTHIGLQMGAVEANPVVAGLMGGVGEAATYAIKMSVVLTAALVLCKLGKPQALKWLNLGMAGVVVSNLVIFVNGFTG